MEKNDYNGISINSDWGLKQVQDGGKADVLKKV